MIGQLNHRDTEAPRKHIQGLTVAAALMILFGLAEIATGFTHNFIGVVSTSLGVIATVMGVTLGAFYFLAGVLVLTRRRWAAITAIVLLAADVLGRVGMVVTGLFPVDSFVQTFSIIVGTVIAALFAIYIWSRRKAFN